MNEYYSICLGTVMRKEFGLFHDNYSLLADCHTEVPDAASMAIIDATGQRLQTR